MATITPPRSAHLTELLIRANSELHHIRQASLTTPKHLQASLLLIIAWASQRSTSSTKTLRNTEAAMNTPRKILDVAVWVVKSMGSIIYIYTASLLLHIKARISLSHQSLRVFSENEAYRMRMVYVTPARLRSSSKQYLPSHHTLGSLDRLSLRGQLPSSVPTRKKKSTMRRGRRRGNPTPSLILISAIAPVAAVKRMVLL